MAQIKRLYILLLVFIFEKTSLADPAEEQRILNIIEDGKAAAANYQLPIDAKQYEPADTTIRDFAEVDFIICGGGASGSVLANELSQSGNFKVLVLEAGNFSDGSNGFLQFPRYFPQHIKSKYNWGYKTVPQTSGCLGAPNRTCNEHRGKGIGGNTLISPVIYQRGHPETYNSWAKLVKDHSWAYKNVLRLFKKIENFHWNNPIAPVDLPSHGTSGPLNVQYTVPDHPMNKRWLDAHRELGFHINDYNGPTPEGGSLVQQYTRNGSREDMGTVFVKPILSRSNLIVLTGSYVIKIEINKESKKQEGVIFTYGGKTYRASALKEVILSAGAIATPQLLLLSGVGPCSHLLSLGIPCVQHLEVGSKFRDHSRITTLLFSTNQTRPVESVNNWVKDYVNNGTGDLTTSTKALPVGLYRTDINKDAQPCTQNEVPNLMIVSDVVDRPPAFVQKNLELTVENTEALWGSNENAITFAVTNVDPKSFGTIRLQSNNPFKFPLIDPRILSNEQDITILYNGIKLAWKIISTKLYQAIGTTYRGNAVPACQKFTFLSENYWRCALRQASVTAYHPFGSCPMGTNIKSGAVVDSKLRVHGIHGIRIADASIFPTSPIGMTDIVTVMVGTKLAEELLKQYC